MTTLLVLHRTTRSKAPAPSAGFGWSAGVNSAEADAIFLSRWTRGLTMKLTDERLEVIRTWLCGGSTFDPVVKPEELAAMANELRQLRLRTSTGSRSAWASEVERQSDVLVEDQIAVPKQRRI